MITGTTKRGFEYSVSEKLGNDFRFVLAYSKVNDGDAVSTLVGAADLARIVLGDDGLAALCKHVAEPDGSVPTDILMEELGEIIQAAGAGNKEVKN